MSGDNAACSPKRNLIVTPDIQDLFLIRDRSVTENDLKRVLRKYNLRNALEVLGNISCDIFAAKDRDLGIVGFTDQATGVHVTQYAIAYLANVFICSGANDQSPDTINIKDNVLGLLGLYQDRLIDSNLANKTSSAINTFFIRLAFQQLNFQKSAVNTISRAIIMFRDIAPKITPLTIKSFDDVFRDANELTLTTYYELCLIVYATAAAGNSVFEKSFFTNAHLPQIREKLTEHNIEKILNILCCNYGMFRAEDSKANKKLMPSLTKNRFNPLFVFPVIETEMPVGRDAYVIPSISAFLDKAYAGIFWWFHRYYEKSGEQRDFRTYFGGVFEAYVGLLLKSAFGTDVVKGEFCYGRDNKRFVDWYYASENKVYLFEAKAYQFALESKIIGSEEIIKGRELKKVIEAIIQQFKKVRDIAKYDDLRQFRGKIIYPITIFLDMPLIDTGLYREWILAELSTREDGDDGLRGLKDFEYNFLNIEDVELYSGLEMKPLLEDIFNGLDDDHRSNFRSKCLKMTTGEKGRCAILDDTYKDLWKAMVKNIPTL